MNLQDFFNKLTPEDRQIVIDHFVRSMLGQPQDAPVVIRRTAKISTLGTKAEMLQEISQAFDIPVEQLGNQQIKEKLSEIRNQFERSEALITDYKAFLLKNKAKEDKYEEAYDMGKFLISIEGEYHIEIPESISTIPDFIVTDGIKRIGIEHTRLINHESKMLIKEIQKILKKVEQLLLANDSQLNQLFNISIIYSKLNLNGKNIATERFSMQEKDTIAAVIATYIRSLLTGDLSISKPEFIENISVSNRPEHPMNINLNEHYLAKSDFDYLFAKTVKAKEGKYHSYINNRSLDELWLLIVASGVSSASSYSLESKTAGNKLISQFDRVILFDNFSHEYINVHQKQ